MRPKKHLGQNFLKSKKIVERMVSDSQISKDDVVLEIGPGKGILTKELLEKAARVIAVEKDTELIPFLTEKFKKEIEEERFIIINEDILTFNLSNTYFKKGYKLIANIPYYITGEIIKKFLESEHQPKTITLLVQKEVARRIVATDKKESILSLSVKVYGVPKITEIVKKTMFTPAPKVDSAVIFISSISKNNLTSFNVEEKKFFEVVKLGFSQKRKRLKGNLSKLGKENIEKVFKENNLNENVRAEDLPLESWLLLSSKL